MGDNCCSQLSAGSAVCDLPSATVQRKSHPEPLCPQCKKKGKAVQGQTVKALLSVSLRLIQDTKYYFCRTQRCPVVYYSADGKSTFSTSQVRERVYQKEPNADEVYVCYCFRHTVGEIRNASLELRNSIIRDITTGIQANLCACDLRNPQGSCCLGNVRGLMKQTEQASTLARAKHPAGLLAQDDHALGENPVGDRGGRPERERAFAEPASGGAHRRERLGEFRQMLAYKCRWYGSRLLAAKRYFPSGKRCSYCGDMLETLPLTVRAWDCAPCGTRHDRDVNAACNLLRFRAPIKTAKTRRTPREVSRFFPVFLCVLCASAVSFVRHS